MGLCVCGDEHMCGCGCGCGCALLVDVRSDEARVEKDSVQEFKFDAKCVEMYVGVGMDVGVCACVFMCVGLGVGRGWVLGGGKVG